MQTRYYFNPEGKPFDPMKDSIYVYKDEAAGWMQGMIHSQFDNEVGVRAADLRDWQKDPDLDVTKGTPDALRNPFVKFRRQSQDPNISMLAGGPIERVTVPPAAAYGQWRAAVTAQGTSNIAMDLAPWQLKAYQVHAEAEHTNQKLIEFGNPPNPIGPPPDFSRVGMYASLSGVYIGPYPELKEEPLPEPPAEEPDRPGFRKVRHPFGVSFVPIGDEEKVSGLTVADLKSIIQAAPAGLTAADLEAIKRAVKEAIKELLLL